MGDDNSGSDDQINTGNSHQKDLENGMSDNDANIEHQYCPSVNEEQSVKNIENTSDNTKTSDSVKPENNSSNNSQENNAVDIPVDNNVSGTASGKIESEINFHHFLKSHDSLKLSITHNNVTESGDGSGLPTDPMKDDNGETVDYQEPEDIGHLDLRVGCSSYLYNHPKPSKKVPFMERITVGKKDDKPETYDVESGIPKHYGLTKLTYNKIVVVCNIKPVTRRGLENKIAVLCAIKGDKRDLLVVPYSAAIGDPIVVDGYSPKTRAGIPYVSDIFKTLGADLRVNKKKQVEYNGIPLKVKTCGSYVTTRLSNCSVGTIMENVDI